MLTIGKWFTAAAAATLGGSALAQEVMPASGFLRQPCPPVYQYAPCPPSAAYPYQPGMTPPSSSTPAVPTEPAPSLSNNLAGLGDSVALNLGGAYIDNATPATMFRLRYDSGYGNNRPDRAEFFYAKCGCFRQATPPQLDARGPADPKETNIDYQEVSSYLEYAVTSGFSVFADIPVRFINPDQNPNAAGIGDVSFGVKYALINCPDRVLSAQVRVIAPSGRVPAGLGTGNWWLEPGLLFLERVSPRWQIFGEVRDQIPLHAMSDFTGNVLRYGIGTSFIVAENDCGYIAPVLETVGWTVLSGKELSEAGAISARGDTIVNAKIGLRFGIGKPSCGSSAGSDFYVGYGRALTGEVWYKNLLRLEYRKFF